MAGSEMLNGWASWLTVASPSLSRASIARRVGSASAPKIRHGQGGGVHPVPDVPAYVLRPLAK